MSKKSEKTLIQEEIDRLHVVFADIPEEKRSVVEGLIERCAFMRVSLQKLEDTMSGASLTEVYQHGKNQSGTKASSELQAYTQMAKIYVTAVKALVSLVPESRGLKESKSNSLMALMVKAREQKAKEAEVIDRSI